jgi:DNA-binding CsgD family transcriptional regulator
LTGSLADRKRPLAFVVRGSRARARIAEGHTSREIAAILSISVNTVERHRHNVLEKLDLRDRVALTLYAVRRGLVQP